MLRRFTGWFWMAVFWWKKRTGWIDMLEDIEVTGEVMKVSDRSGDGDLTFGLRLDPGQDRYITGLGGRLTTEDRSNGPSIHCEIAPWSSDELRAKFPRVGDRVRVKGRWGFDGVHVPHPYWVQVIYALVRHQPSVHTGWFEVHPVAEIERI